MKGSKTVEGILVAREHHKGFDGCQRAEPPSPDPSAASAVHEWLMFPVGEKDRRYECKDCGRLVSYHKAGRQILDLDRSEDWGQWRGLPKGALVFAPVHWKSCMARKGGAQWKG